MMHPRRVQWKDSVATRKEELYQSETQDALPEAEI